MLHAKNMII
jgi:hypothetical protein